MDCPSIAMLSHVIYTPRTWKRCCFSHVFIVQPVVPWQTSHCFQGFNLRQQQLHWPVPQVNDGHEKKLKLREFVEEDLSFWWFVCWSGGRECQMWSLSSKVALFGMRVNQSQDFSICIYVWYMYIHLTTFVISPSFCIPILSINPTNLSICLSPACLLVWLSPVSLSIHLFVYP